MLEAKRIQSLPEMREPVLTVYLNTNPGDRRNQGSPPGYLIWLKSRARLIGERVQLREQRDLQDQLKRVESFLRTNRPSSRGLALFAGPATWEEIPLHVDVEDELHWGRPSLTQLMWLLDEHQPYGVVLVDRSGARFFRFWLGEAEEQAEERFDVDISEWREKSLVAPARPGVQRTRGSQRDVFQQRLEAQFDRLYREVTNRIGRWIAKERLRPVLIAGPGEIVESIWNGLPAAARGQAATIKSDLSDLGPADLQARIAPDLTRWKRAHELETVTRLVNGESRRRVALGMDETLRHLQEGKIRSLVVARGLGGRIRQCAACGWTDRSADRTCVVCGGERHAVALRAALPELARRFSVHVEVVSGEATRKLREVDGMAGWLR